MGPETTLKGLWLTSMGMGATRTGNVRYMRQVTKLLQNYCDLELIYYCGKQNIENHGAELCKSFSKVHWVEAPPGYSSRPRGGDNGLSSINDFISCDLIDWCEANISSEKYDFIVCDYIYMAAVYDSIDDKIVKIINSHDKIGNRHLALGWDEDTIKQHFSVNEKEEIRAIEKADIVVTITEQERSYFSAIRANEKFQSKALLVQHLPDRTASQFRQSFLRPSELTLGFLGSSNPVNTDGITKLLQAFCNMKPSNLNILLAGKICSNISHKCPGLSLIGEVENEGVFYEKVDCLINPMPKGSSGLKIKTIDALANSIPVIGTRDAFWGVETSSKWHNFDTIESMCDSLFNHPINQGLLDEITSDSLKCRDTYFNKTEGQISVLVDEIRFLRKEKIAANDGIRLDRSTNRCFNRIIANIHDGYADQLSFYKHQAKLNWDKFNSCNDQLMFYKRESKHNWDKFNSCNGQLQKLLENRDAKDKLNENHTSLQDIILQRTGTHSIYASVSKLLQHAPIANPFESHSVFLEHGLGIGDGLLFSPLVKLKYCLNFKHVYLKTPRLKGLASRLYADCSNLSVVESVPDDALVHKIDFMEAVYHPSWRYPAYMRNISEEESALKRFTNIFGDRYILIHERLSDNMSRKMKPINQRLIYNPEDLPLVNLDLETMTKHGLSNIDYLDFRLIIESAYSIHFYEGSFSHLADICDLSKHKEQPSLHLYCKPHLWDESLPHNKILFFLEMNNWFSYNWKVFTSEQGDIIKKRR